MKKVLITLDYNPASEGVMKKGYELAQLMGAEVCLLHILSDLQFYGIQYEPFMGYEGATYPIDPTIQDGVINVAKEYLQKAVEHLKDPNVKTHLAEGDTAKTILEYAEEWKADVIVMGTHSHSTLEKLFMGSVASSVIEHTKIPVYLVPTGEK